MIEMAAVAHSVTVVTCAAPKLREASFDDYPRIALLQRGRDIRVRSREKWRHLWEANPAYLDMGRKWPIGWVLETGDKIVGYCGNIPARYELDGKQLTAACGYSWVVEPAYSAYSMLLLYEYLRQENAAMCISTTAGPISYKAHMALGAVPIPAGAWERSALWITSYPGFVASWLGRKKWPAPHAFSYPVSAALYARDAIRQRIRKSSGANGHIEIQCCEQFDEKFDEFWQVLRAENPHKLLAERSQRVLEWHFRYLLQEKKLWIATVGERSSLRAYAIFGQLSNKSDEEKRVVLIDFQSAADKTELFYPLLEWALEKCASEGIHLFQTIGLCPSRIGDVSALAPYAIRQQTRPLYKALHSSLTARLKDPEVWSLSLFDGDATV